MKLRIIAGELRGQRFDAPTGFTTHPMGDRIRTALFNKLGDISGKRVLDPFAGSGAISFEAISRGAFRAIAIERDRKAQLVIERNITELKLAEKVKLIKANCRAWSENNPDKLYDIVICDPPYDDIKLSTITMLATHLQPNGLMVLSQPGRETAPSVSGVVVVDKSSYGDAALIFYRKGAAEIAASFHV